MFKVEKNLVDKLSAVTKSKILNTPIKDLYDAYLIINNFNIDVSKMLEISKFSGKSINRAKGVLDLENMRDILHDYKIYTGIVNKAEIDIVLDSVIGFLLTLFLEERKPLSRRDIITNPVIKGTLCCDSATWYWNLTTYVNTRTTYYTDIPTENRMRYIGLYYKPIEDRRNIILINDKLSVTSKEQTICDLVLFKLSADLIQEAISNYDEKEDYTELLKVAVENNILKEVKYFIDTMYEYWENK